VLVDLDTPGIERVQTTVADSSAQYELRFRGVRVPAANRLGPAGGGWDLFEDVMDDALVAWPRPPSAGRARPSR
jgi:alkylation response protein AidB-like acyl-CoA dehydrogenase